MAWSPWSSLCPSAQQLIRKKREKRRSTKTQKHWQNLYLKASMKLST